MIIEYELTPRNFLKLYKTVFICFFILLAAIVVIFSIYTDYQYSEIIVIGGAIGTVVGYQQMSKQYAFGKHTVEITPDHLKEINPNNNETHQWGNIKSIHKSKIALSIFTTNKRNLIIPLQNFSSEEDYNKFCELALSYYEQAKKAAN